MSYLDESYQQFKREHPTIKSVGTLRDGYGVYAYIIQRPGNAPHIFCAKNSQKGEYISCHEKLIEEAQKLGCPILIRVKGNTYRFFAKDILKAHHYPNEHHGAKFINFSIKVGRNLKEVLSSKDKEEAGKHGIIKTFETKLDAVKLQGELL